MKKFLVCFVVLSAMVFMIGCGKALDQAKALREPQWSSRSSQKMSWNDAKAYCSNLNEGGHKDWRLPNIDEVKSLVRNCAYTQLTCKVSEKNACLSKDCGENQFLMQLGKSDHSCHCDLIQNAAYYSILNDDVLLLSSSILADDSTKAWAVAFDSAAVVYGPKTAIGNVRCIR